MIFKFLWLHQDHLDNIHNTNIHVKYISTFHKSLFDAKDSVLISVFLIINEYIAQLHNASFCLLVARSQHDIFGQLCFYVELVSIMNVSYIITASVYQVRKMKCIKML